MSVEILLRNSRPSTIRWFVIAVVIYAVYGMPCGGAFPHVRKEVREATRPSVADNDAARHVAGVFLAALNHPLP